MDKRLLASIAAALLLLAAVAGSAQEAAGRIEGRVLRPDGSGVGGVSVALAGRTGSVLTDPDGRFAFGRVEPGEHDLTFTLGRHHATSEGIAVATGETARLEQTVDWPLAFVETVTVSSISRRPERIVEAPAAMSFLPEAQIAREAAGGALPKLLEFTPGVELTQGGLYEFNFNVRGFNDPIHRRVLTLVDGRDVSIPSLGSQEWAAIGFPLDDLQSAELIRGPGSALYGSDAFNGVLNLVTRAPRHSQGGRVRLTGGEMSTRQLDLRYATGLGGRWYAKVLGGYTESDDFFGPRTTSVEYSTPCAYFLQGDCLPLEAVAPPLSQDEIAHGSLRLDGYLTDSTTLVVEGGTAQFQGPVAVAEFGRLQVLDVERPWARLNLNAPHWNVQGAYTARDGRQLWLNLDSPFYTESDRLSLEVQGHASFADGKGHLVGGASAMEENVDSADPNGFQTVTYKKHNEDFQAVFGQVEYSFTDRLRGVLAARWDQNSIHDSRLSPRGALVWAIRPEHTLRLTYGEAFLTPGYAQLVLYLPSAPPVDLSPFEGICALGGTSCGFGEPVAIRAVGNSELEAEEVRSFEVGYSAILGDDTFLTVDYYDSRFETFISDYLPFFDPSRGRLASPYQPYSPPADLPPQFAGLLMASLEQSLPPELFALLSTGVFGEPVFIGLSLVNFGQVESQGIEVALNRRMGTRWSFDLGYAWFDFEIRDRLPDDPALPNSAENRAHAAATYVGDAFDAALRYRWVDGFEWSAGLYRGQVPSYQVVDLTANRTLGRHWRLGLNVSNLLDEEHFEFFGADLLGRRALVHLDYAW